MYRHWVSYAALAIVFTDRVCSTNFLAHDKLLENVEDAAWFEENVPLLDIPDEEIQAVYYYRWESYRQHLYYTGKDNGYLATEFLMPVSWGGPYGGISAAAGHHINEGRWLRDQRFGQDVVNYWLTGPGLTKKPVNYDFGTDSFDWAHEYSFWCASSVWRQALATGSFAFAISHLDDLVKQYRGWDNHFNPDLNLYWQAPVWDATEFTAASYQSSDPYHGGYGYRPTINSYQYGDAIAIAKIAEKTGNSALAAEYNERATALQEAVQKYLWDDKDMFFKHRARDDNPSGSLLVDRELQGYIPWMFNLPESNNSYSPAFKQLKDSSGFATAFGPTTLETRSKWFMHDAYLGCCRWTGPSWPFATAQTLTAVEVLLNDYPAQSDISAADYIFMLTTYAKTQMKNGKPYVAEAHDPDKDDWMYDTYDHSEDYNHSTFVDNIISGLLGIRAQADDTVVVNPLCPTSWDHFALENVAYHGHNVTVVWDQTGSVYKQGKGLSVWVDDNLAGHSDELKRITVPVGPVIPQQVSDLVNVAVNPLKQDQGAQPFTSYNASTGGDDMWHAIDGLIFRVGIPENSRWTSYKSLNAQDHFGVDLRRNYSIDYVRIFFYGDGAGVQLPTSYDLEYRSGNNTWVSVPHQDRQGNLAANAGMRIMFPAISASQLRVVAPNRQGGVGWGISELEVWVKP